MIGSGQKLLMARAGFSIPWDVSRAVYSGDSFSVATEEATPRGLFFKPDGAKLYVTGNTGDAVYEYDLSTDWDISSASYLQTFSVSAQDAGPQGLFLKPDGTKMYVVGSGNDAVYEYDLSTAWDISTASYLQAFSLGGSVPFPSGVFFKPDGTKMYVMEISVTDAVYEYDLSTAWDVSSASYLHNFGVSSQDIFPEGLFFKPDGTKMYVVGRGGDAVYEYDLSTAWDVSSASYLQSFSVGAQEGLPSDVFFKSDGTKMYIIGTSNDSIFAYDI